MTTGCEVHELRVHTRAGRRLVDRTDLDVARGNIMGIVGETGAGKTLTMRALLGLLPGGVRAEGQIRVGDGPSVQLEDRTGLHAFLGSKTSVVLQNPVGMLDPLMRVGDQLVEGVVARCLMTRAEARSRSHTLLAKMGFRDPEALQRMYPHELSGGMAQRAVTAMSMMPRPELLVLDEPTSALDANVRVEVLNLFRALARDEGSAVFLVSHDLGLVAHFCDTLGVMYAGRIVERGTTAEVLRAPAHPYTVALLESSASLDRPRRVPLPVIRGAPPAPGAWPEGCVFEPRCPRRAKDCRTHRPVLEQHNDQWVACHYPYRRQAA
jgi:oligopeptide/dipeptide ABC transporter ATP-binding protein